MRRMLHSSDCNHLTAMSSKVGSWKMKSLAHLCSWSGLFVLITPVFYESVVLSLVSCTLSAMSSLGGRARSKKPHWNKNKHTITCRQGSYNTNVLQLGGQNLNGAQSFSNGIAATKRNEKCWKPLDHLVHHHVKEEASGCTSTSIRPARVLSKSDI